MIIYTNNIFAGPLLLAVWAIDIYLLLVSLRLITAQIPSISKSGFSRNLRQFTDPVIDVVRRKLTKYRVPWLPWLIVILSGLVIRQVLIAIIVM